MCVRKAKLLIHHSAFLMSSCNEKSGAQVSPPPFKLLVCAVGVGAIGIYSFLSVGENRHAMQPNSGSPVEHCRQRCDWVGAGAAKTTGILSRHTLFYTTRGNCLRPEDDCTLRHDGGAFGANALVAEMHPVLRVYRFFVPLIQPVTPLPP